MDLDQSLRNMRRTVQAKLANVRAHYESARDARARAAREAEAKAAARAAARRRWRPAFIVFAACAAAVLFYPLAAWWGSRVDDDLAFAPQPAQGEASHVIAAVAGLLDREVNRNGWTPNAPFFMPAALLTDKPNFQRGVVFALAAIAAAFPADADMREAAILLRYPPDDWVGDPAISFWSGSSQTQYRKALTALRRANAKPADPSHGAERLSALLRAIRADLNTEAVAMDARIQRPSGFVFSHALDGMFYTAKGRLYADAIVLAAARRDFASLIEMRGSDGDWTDMMKNLQLGAALHPALVMNGAPGSLLLPCHLCTEGYFLARADAAMGRVSARLK
jgi:hypothetical protein